MKKPALLQNDTIPQFFVEINRFNIWILSNLGAVLRTQSEVLPIEVRYKDVERPYA